MPNIPLPLQGFGLQPRTIEGATKWNQMRKLCYHKANYRCEACGKDLGKGECQAHELFDYDYPAGTATFNRLVCLCKSCHLSGVHSGRALTLYKQGDPIWNKNILLNGVEHAFRTIYEYNKEHGTDYRMFGTFLAYIKEPELETEMKRLVNKYHIKFYSPKNSVPWSEWRMLYKGREYRTPYADKDAYDKHFAQVKKNEGYNDLVLNLQGGIFDEVDNLIKEAE